MMQINLFKKNTIAIKDERQKQMLIHLLHLRINVNSTAIMDTQYRQDPILLEYYSQQNKDLREIKEQLTNIKF